MIETIQKILVIAFAVGAITFTISVTSIFLWLRELISRINKKLEELIHCPWCLSFWIIILLIVEDGHCIVLLEVSKSFVKNFFITVFSIMSISGLIHYVLLRAYIPVAEAMMHRELKKLKKNEQKISSE